MTDLNLKALNEYVRATTPLIHCITNYVTVNDCANALLAIGASPIMSDEPQDVSDITSICGGLVLNIGTLNLKTIEGMFVAGTIAGSLGHPIVLDPVGAGASGLRTQTASKILDEMNVTVIKANMSEAKALAGASAKTRGVDVNPDDVVTEDNLDESVEFVKELAKQTGTIAAITGAIDIVSDGEKAYIIRNGSPMLGLITGAGCILSCVVGAYVVANPEDRLEAVVAALVHEGAAGEVAASRMSPEDGNGTFHIYFLDALTTMDGDTLTKMAKVSVA
ncbi:MAG: hydroxyethylthiazole kinase [Eggerthellaceae bacterium]|nr:hydroxyethylthiazole kinase [Eggerthellaceae bacterium]